jgi:hypothetical protein
MIQTIIDYLNLRVETLGRIAHLYGITEKRKRSGDDAAIPYAYVGAGQFEPVDIDNGNAGWWRPRSGFTMEPVEVIGRAVKQQRASYPLRFVAVLRRDLSVADDAFMPSRLAEDISNALNFDNGDLRNILRALNVEARTSSVEFDASAIWATEFHTSIPDLHYELAMVAVDVTVEVVAKYSCWEGECATDLDILRLFNFCDPSVVARLSPTQVACLEAAICPTPPTLCEQLAAIEPADVVADVFDCLTEAAQDELLTTECEDATITVNAQPFGTSPSGGSLNVPVIQNGNPVGSRVGSNWVIPNCADGLLGINGNAGLVSVPSGGTANLEVRQGGVNVGSWDGTRWIVPNCADATFSIDGTQVDTVASGADLDVTLLLDGVAPPSYTYNAGTDTLNVISPPPSSGWVRNPDWLPMPTVGAEEFVMLLAVFENRTNRLTMAVSGVALVDYGDGTTVNSNGLAQLKTYDYTTIVSPVSVDPVTGQNYKQVVVKVSRISANITAITFTGGPVFALDIEATLPNATNLNLVVSNLPLYLCERIVINSISASYNTLERLVNGSNRLRVITFPWGTPTSLGGGASFTSCPIDDLGNVTSSSSTFTSFFGTSQIVKAGTITNNTATNWSFLFDQSALLQQLTAVNSTSMTTGLVAFRGCSKLRGTVTVNCPAQTSAESMFQNDAQLDGLIFTNAASITNTTNLVNGCRMLGNLVMNGLTRGINLTTTNLGNFGMSNFANSIGTASGAQTITVTGTPFGTLLTALDATAVAIRNVMTGKGYTVAN